ncbi:PIN domain-containing protein [Spirosoma gilvum]
MEESFTRKLFSSLELLSINQAIADRVITYRKLRKIKLPDAIILATARENDCHLITQNVDDFVGLDQQVVIINPFNK